MTFKGEKIVGTLASYILTPIYAKIGNTRVIIKVAWPFTSL